MFDADFLSQIRASLEVQEDSAKLRSTSFKTSSGISLKNSYLPSDIPDHNPITNLGKPGAFPFTRHAQTTGYRGRLWTIRQYAGFATAEESNERYRFLLSQGTNGLSVAFDLPTQIGLDPDHEMAQGEVGKVGVSIASIHDMRILFNEIPLDQITTSMTINAPASVLLAMYLVLAKERGIPWSTLRGTSQNDIFKEYMARGTYIFPPHPSLRLATDLIAFCSENVPNWNPISVSGYHIREAGCTAVQEVAFTLADGIAYLEAGLARGLAIESFAPRFSFFFNSHNQFFEEIAKFRAARRLWAYIIRDRFKCNDVKSQILRFHTQTAGSTLTAQQPDNNIARTTVQAMAAILGGTQSLHTNGRDEALSLPTQESAQIALRTQQILAHETRLGDVVDPLGGSYFVESLTNEIELQAKELINKIDAMGGMLSAIEKGYPQREIQNAAYQYQMSIQSKDQIIVGVNEFAGKEKIKPTLLRVDEELTQKRNQSITMMKSKRNQKVVDAALLKITKTAQTDQNLMPSLIEAITAEVTLGEICAHLRDVFGEHQERLTL